MSDDDVGMLPAGWEITALGDMADCRLGKMLDQVKNRGEERPYLRNVNVQWGHIALDDVKHMRIAADEVERYGVRPGDLLVCEGGEPGRCAVWRDDREMYLQKALHRVRPRGGSSANYLRWWLQDASNAGRLDHLLTGSTIKHLPGRQLARIGVALPPVAEQHRIAQRLDEIDVRRRAAASHLDGAQRIVERFRRAVLDAACSGRLTADWREDNPNSASDSLASWRSVTLGELSDTIRGGSSEVPVVGVTDFPVLRSSSVRPLCVNYDDVRYLSRAQSQKAVNFIEDGDLLITRLNGNIEYVGNAAVVDGVGHGRLQYPDRPFRLKLQKPEHAPYVELFLASSRARGQVQAASRSAAGHQRISIADLEGFLLELPPPDEQHEIVRRANALLATAERLTTQIEQVESTLERVGRGSLVKAFRGDLVPTEAAMAEAEDREYESAGRLLARVSTTARRRSPNAPVPDHSPRSA